MLFTRRIYRLSFDGYVVPVGPESWLPEAMMAAVHWFAKPHHLRSWV